MAKLKNFIIVQSESVASQLIANGFNLLSESGGVYTFVNDEKKKINFADIDTTKIYFTDILTF